MPRARGEWIKSAITTLLKDPKDKDRMLPTNQDVSMWPEKYQQFRVTNTPVSESDGGNQGLTHVWPFLCLRSCNFANPRCTFIGAL